MSGPQQGNQTAKTVVDGAENTTGSKIDRQGIDLLPADKRYGQARDLFFLWAGTTTNIFTVSYGAMLVIFFGQSFTSALAAIILGNILAYPLLGITSTQGPATGTTTITISRTWLGVRGARLNGVFAWVMLLGFEAGGLILIYYSAQALLATLGLPLTAAAAKITVIVALALIQLLIPLVGHRLLMSAQKYATFIFAVAFVVLAMLIIPRANLNAVGTDSSLVGFISAVSLVMVSGGLSWAPSGANFSRFLPSNTPRAKVATRAALGGFLPYLCLQTLGAAMATIAVDKSVDLTNPLAIPAILPTAFSVPFLLLVLTGLMIQNATNLYSSGLNLQTAGINVPRHLIVVIDSAICVGITILAVYQSSFYELLNVFLGSLSLWLAPWVTIHILDWYLRRRHVDLDGLANTSGGPYWGRGGVNLAGLVSLLAGMIGAYLLCSTGYYAGPLSTWLGAVAGPVDLSVVGGALVAGTVYLLTHKKLS